MKLNLAIILAAALGPLAIFIGAMLLSSCTLREDCQDCILEVKVPNLPNCVEYHPDADTLTVCPDAKESDK